MSMRLLVIGTSLVTLHIPSAVHAQATVQPTQQAASPETQPSGNKTPEQPATPAPPKPWWERLTFYGDFRARYEGFFQEEVESRQRERFRFRIGMRTPVFEGLDFNLRLASGDAADVTSTNQSLTDFLNRKPINIDQLSLAYTPTTFKPLTLGVGKYAMPVTRTQMVWDDDVNWEGTYEQLSFSGGLPVTFRLVGVQSPINEVGAGEDAFMFGEYAQAGFRVAGHAVQISVADYVFRNPDQIAVALDQRAVIRTQSTNVLRRNEAGRVVGYESGFNLVDMIAQATFTTASPEYPLVALADYVVNTEAAHNDDTGVWIVGSYGRAATPRTFAATYTFARVERDAVVSAYNFSDMGPATNVVMNMATFSYMPRSRVNLDFIAILTKLIDVPLGERNPLLKRIQIDARVAF
jgi:hypothetical protein